VTILAYNLRMPLSVVSKILATLLVPAVLGVAVTTIANQTILNSHYVEGKLAATNSYERLSTALTDQISQKTPGGANPQVTATLKSVLAPKALQTKINGTLDQLQAYYRGDGPQPVIDLTDLAAQAQTAGVPIPADSDIAKPIPLQNSGQLKDYSKKFDSVRQAAIISTVVLVAALVIVCWRRHLWVALPDVAIWIGALLLPWVLGASALSGVLRHYVAADTTANTFSLLAGDLASAIATDLAKRLGLIVLVLGVGGIVVRIWLGRIASSGPTQQALQFNPKPASPIIN
jgi:hypothetical protein